MGKADKLQHSLDRIFDGLKTMSQTGSMTGPQVDDAYNVRDCLTLLNSLHGIEKGSTLYIIAIRVLTKPVNGQTFVHLM